MHCCFMFNLLRMESQPELTPSVAEYIEQEKLCQEMCKITQSVENTGNPATALLPENNSDDDDIEGILQQISELLGAPYVGNSISEGDNLSVEEILKEAENLVRASTPYFERQQNDPNVHETKETEIERDVSPDLSDATELEDEPEDDFEGDKTPVNENQNIVESQNVTNLEREYRDIPEVELKLSDLRLPGSTYTIDPEQAIEICDTEINRVPPPIEESVLELQKHIEMLNAKVASYENQEVKSHKSDTLSSIERQRLKLLQDEVKSQEELIDGYQKENQRLTNDIISAKDAWKETEVKLLDKVKKLDLQLKQCQNQRSNDNEELSRKLREAYDSAKRLEVELIKVKEENIELKSVNEDLSLSVTRLNGEIKEYKKEIQFFGKNESEKLAVLENNALIQSKLSQANTEVTRKQTEIVRLNGEIGRLRGELEKIRLGSVVNQNADSTNTISQLQAALAMERENCRAMALERENLTKEIIDSQNRNKEMEYFFKKSKSGVCLPHSESPLNTLNRKNKEQELNDYKEQYILNKKNLKELQMKYDHDVYELEQQLKRLQRDNTSLKHLIEDVKSDKKRLANTAKEDAHLLATIRGLKLELSAREKDIMRLNKELDDAKKTNKRLQKEREKALNSGTKLRSAPYSRELEKPSSRASDVSATKDYNPSLYEDNQEAVSFLRNENRSLKVEIKRLEQDLISLHNKRIQDLSDLQEQHESEIARMVREHASKHSASTVAHLQSQLYTQQMVIHHLKEQVKELEDRKNDVALLKSERDHLETTLIEANKKIARLHDLASPENMQYSGLLEKLEFLERRHEVREQKLQAIVRDLIAKQSQAISCGSNCRDKLLNKNREMCYYRAEMDKILATLAEFRWTP